MEDEYLFDPTWRAAGKQNVRALLEQLDDEDARNELSEALFHQGDRYPASAASIPRLVAALESGSADIHAFVLGLLPILAFGDFERFFPQIGELESEESDDWTPYAEPTGKWPRACWAAVAEAMPTIAPYAHAALDRVALPVFPLLALYPGYEAVLAGVDAKRPLRRACALFARAYRGDQSVRSEAASLALHPDPVVAVHAAACGVPSDCLRAEAESKQWKITPFTGVLSTLARRALRTLG